MTSDEEMLSLKQPASHLNSCSSRHFYQTITIFDEKGLVAFMRGIHLELKIQTQQEQASIIIDMGKLYKVSCKSPQLIA